MRLLMHICLTLLLPVVALCQPGYMKNGKVYKGDTPFCTYKESGYRISTLTMGNPDEVGNPNAYPEAVGDPFKDYSFGTEYQSFITAKAKIFATAHELFIVYFYNIRFETMDLELNVRYNPLLIRTLAQDMVKYDVMSGGFVNEKNMRKLIDKWSEKNGVLNTAHLQKGVVNNYNSSTPTPPEKAQSINIRIAGDKIYRNDTLIGSYHMDMHLPLGNLHGSSKNNYLYRIDDTTGKFLAWVKVPMARSVFFISIPEKDESLCVVTTDRDERKIIASAAKVLTVHLAAKQ